MSVLMLAICWLPPLLHGWWLLGDAIRRRVEESTRLAWAIDYAIDQQRQAQQYRYTYRPQWRER